MAIIQRDPLERLAHWEPFRGIEHLQREVNQLFDRFLPVGSSEIGSSEMQSLIFPSAEIEETDDTIYLKIEIPGMEAKDLTVEVTEGSVAIKGERKSESKTETKGVVRSEFQYGKFERRIPLTTYIQTDKVQAECKNGMLHLTLPKVDAEQRKVVKVNIS